ncbi:MAG TPA: hypothetical protein VLM79_20230 [Kofleriaceae bacterium]|nr:hypothetical protein [Kofleriaceae bacterium]
MRMTEHAERSAGCLSRLHCDQLLNGELDDREDLKQHCASCQRCTALLAAHRRERAAFAVPRAHAGRWARGAGRWVMGLAAIAAALCVWLVASRDRLGGAEIRSKGKPALAFYVKHGDAVREGAPGEVVGPKDAINFVVSTEQPAFLAIISVDGAGKVSAYYPEGPTAAAIPAGRDRVLPRSVLLDDTLGLERVVGVFCDRPIAVAELAAAVARDAIPSGCVSDALTLEKRRTP